MTLIDAVQHVGTSVINFNFQIAYQQMAGYWIPAHLDVNMAGAYSIAIDLIGCSVSKEITVRPPAPAAPKSNTKNF
jgi:hypothetical protein